MKPGDIITEEPPVGSIVRDNDGDEYIYGKNGRMTADGGAQSTWQFVRANYGPMTLVKLPEQPAEPDPEWEPVEPEDVRVGDEIEITRQWRGRDVTASYRGVVTRRNRTTVMLGVAGCPVSIETGVTSIRRKVCLPMPEPGLGAVVEVGRERYFHADEAIEGDDKAWIRVDVSVGTFEWVTWHEITLAGTPTVLLPAATP